jgi:hypothetical protein
MLWDDPQFPHGSEPKALNLLQGGTLWEAMMGVIIRETVEALYGALCGTLWEAITGSTNASAVSYCIIIRG